MSECKTLWAVRYKGSAGFFVTAHTFFEAVVAAERYIEYHCLDRSSVLAIEYIAY